MEDHPRPLVIPTVQDWTPAPGSYRLGAASRIVVDRRHASDLHDTGVLLAEDVRARRGTELPVVVAEAAGPGDVLLSVDRSLAPEAYTLALSESADIAGGTRAGVLHGTRTLLQLLARSTDVPAGRVADAPRYPERGLMVDVGRKPFSLAWLRRRIDELSLLKLDLLHLHLSDDLGFRVESARHPEIVSATHLSHRDIRDLVAYADRRGVMIVPEIDMPGHMGAILAAHPTLQLRDAAGRADPRAIDLSLDGAYELMGDIVEEAMALFDAPYWHVGADEYLDADAYARHPQLLASAQARHGPRAVARDAYYGFLHWVDARVRDARRTTRMWNDGIVASDGAVEPPHGVVVEYWTKRGLSPQEHLERGNRVLNASWTPTYHVLGRDRIVRPDVRYLYEEWTPDVFEISETLRAPAHSLGSKIHVWCDEPAAQGEDEIADDIRAALCALAQKTWGSPLPVVGYAGFRDLIAAVGDTAGRGSDWAR